MKMPAKKVEVMEVDNEGLVSLLGQNVALFCANFIYAGKLVGVNETCVKLEGAGIVYETGAFSANKWKDFQTFPANTHYVMLSAIESFGKIHE